MQHRQHVFLFGLIMMGLVACNGQAPPDDVHSRKFAMIYGSVLADEPITQVDFFEYGKTYIRPFSRTPRVLVYDDGTFMAENIRPGKYVIAAFHAGDKNQFNLVRSKQQAYQKVIHVRPGELKYVGSYRIHVTKSRLLGKGKFEVEEVLRPGERQVLRNLQVVTDGTGWQKMIERRLKELWQ
ncbi:MAG: hypothetical protein R6X06_04570 [Gammaproteobacteria bacterium]